MKRLVIILILMLFPLQATWAAIGAYCQHESGATAQHFGHHAHQHKADEGKSKKSSLPKLDADCAFCCVSGIAHFVSSLHYIPIDTLSVTHALAASDALPSSLHERPERPKWVAIV